MQAAQHARAFKAKAVLSFLPLQAHGLNPAQALHIRVPTSQGCVPAVCACTCRTPGSITNSDRPSRRKSLHIKEHSEAAHSPALCILQHHTPLSNHTLLLTPCTSTRPQNGISPLQHATHAPQQ